MTTLRWVRMTRLVPALAGLLLAGAACEDSGGGGSSFPRSFTVPADRENGARFTAPAAATYTFTITGGAYSFTDPGQDWHVQLRLFVNKPIAWGPGANPEPVNATATLGDWFAAPSREEAEARGAGARVSFTLDEGGYVIFIVSGRRGWFDDNVGAVTLRIEQAL